MWLKNGLLKGVPKEKSRDMGKWQQGSNTVKVYTEGQHPFENISAGSFAWRC